MPVRVFCQMRTVVSEEDGAVSTFSIIRQCGKLRKRNGFRRKGRRAGPGWSRAGAEEAEVRRTGKDAAAGQHVVWNREAMQAMRAEPGN